MSSCYEEVMEGGIFLPFHLDHLTLQMKQIAKEELNENKDTRSSSIKQLRELIIKEKNLKCRMDDEFLLQFLRARKFNVENAFTHLQSFYQVTSKTFADVYANIGVVRAKKAFKSGFGSLLPYRDHHGAAFVLLKIGNWKVKEIDVPCIMTCLCALVLSAIDNPATQVCGLHFLVDAKGIKLNHILSFYHPRFMLLMARWVDLKSRYRVTKAFQVCLPARLKGIHIINAPAIFRYLWRMERIYWNEKTRKRVHFHDGNMESLHQLVPKEILPTEYGGDNPNFDPIEQGSAELEKFLPKYLKIIHDGFKKN